MIITKVWIGCGEVCKTIIVAWYIKIKKEVAGGSLFFI
jgi:hypothetical protein